MNKYVDEVDALDGTCMISIPLTCGMLSLNGDAVDDNRGYVVSEMYGKDGRLNSISITFIDE